MFEKRPLIVSIFLALATYIAFILSGISGGFIAVLLGAIAVGYMINGTIKDGAIHGAIIGIIVVIIATALLLIQYAGVLALVGTALYQSIALQIVFGIIFGLIGGIIGTLINSESLVPEESGETAEPEENVEPEETEK